MRILSADIGFGYTKATDGRRTQIFKSLVGEANPVQVVESLLPAAPESEFPRHFELGEEKIFIGELAERQSRSRSFTLDPGQFIEQYARPLALAALAPFAEHGDPVRLVTGLPIGFFRRYHERLTTLLQNRHTITIVHGDGKAEEKQIHIERVRVIPQPFGSLFNLMLDDAGKIVAQRFASEKIGVIDIGFRTTDLAIADRTRYSERGSASTESGVSLAFAVIANVLQERSGVSVELYRLYEALARGSIKIKGKRHDLKGLAERALTHLATRIATEVGRLWADDWDIDAVVLTGGGGTLLAPYLQPLLEGEVLPIAADRDARLNNVLGYQRYGAHIWPPAAAAA
jgi:hypothetical protein